MHNEEIIVEYYANMMYYYANVKDANEFAHGKRAWYSGMYTAEDGLASWQRNTSI